MLALSLSMSSSLTVVTGLTVVITGLGDGLDETVFVAGLDGAGLDGAGLVGTGAGLVLVPTGLLVGCGALVGAGTFLGKLGASFIVFSVSSSSSLENQKISSILIIHV